jgi:hypothetical protein
MTDRMVGSVLIRVSWRLRWSPARVMSRTHQGDEAMDEAPNLKSELVSVGFKKEKKKTLTEEI